MHALLVNLFAHTAEEVLITLFAKPNQLVVIDFVKPLINDINTVISVHFQEVIC